MKRIIVLTLAIAAGSAALASEGHGKLDAATEDAIRTQLTADGYDVRKIETEDGLFEAYALKDGERYEIYFDADLKIVDSKRDD